MLGARLRRLHASCPATVLSPRGGALGFTRRSRRDRAAVGGELGSIPTTHSVGDLARALIGRALPELVHVYFHDTDLRDRRRRLLVQAVLRLLAQRAAVTDLDTLAGELLPGAPRVPWADVARL